MSTKLYQAGQTFSSQDETHKLTGISTRLN